MKLKTLLCALVFIFLSATSTAQPQTGRITGTVQDAFTDAPLIGANVIVVGTSLGAATDVNGNYQFLNVPVGTYQIQTSFIGYQTVTKSGIAVQSGSTSQVSFRLIAEAAGPALLHACVDTCVIIRAQQNLDPDTLVIRLWLCNELNKNLTNVGAEIRASNLLFCGDSDFNKFQPLKTSVFYGDINDGACAKPDSACAEFRYTTDSLGTAAGERCLHFSLRTFGMASCQGAEIASEHEIAILSCYHLKFRPKPAVVSTDGNTRKWILGISATVVAAAAIVLMAR